MRIVIVGAGVAGTVLARALARHPGLDVTCLERAAPGHHAGARTGMVIAPNAVKALHLRDPLLASAIGEAGLPWDHWRESQCSGETLADLPLTRVADHGGVRILRAALYRVLRHGAGSAVRYRCNMLACGSGARDPARGYVEWEQDGRRHRLDDIDLLVGADGAASATRMAFAGNGAEPRDGVRQFRLLVPDSGAQAGAGDGYEQWRNGASRLCAIRMPDGLLHIAGTLPGDGSDGSNGSPATPARLRAALQAAFEPAHAALAARPAWLLETLCRHADAVRWSCPRVSPPRYAEPRTQVMYLGDSAHATAAVPGLGATQAIEDACCAAQLIASALARGDGAPRAWLAGFEANRRARLRAVASALPDGAPAPGKAPKEAPETAPETAPDQAPRLDALRRLYCEIALPA
ncbi:FAD-dependent oxidoreductase [Cupriavidus sp. 30B13]|uniref:FAD-dependent oxidoreductase n=1 Tax=Cupriavidus sp. 30B13 TaxID=3384241 RepID=UPI003B90389A